MKWRKYNISIPAIKEHVTHIIFILITYPVRGKVFYRIHRFLTYQGKGKRLCYQCNNKLTAIYFHQLYIHFLFCFFLFLFFPRLLRALLIARRNQERRKYSYGFEKQELILNGDFSLLNCCCICHFALHILLYYDRSWM